MSNETLKTVAAYFLIGLGVVFAVTGLSEAVFGDLTGEDSYKPLIIAVPVLAGLFLLLKGKLKK